MRAPRTTSWKSFSSTSVLTPCKAPAQQTRRQPVSAHLGASGYLQHGPGLCARLQDFASIKYSCSQHDTVQIVQGMRQHLPVLCIHNRLALSHHSWCLVHKASKINGRPLQQHSAARGRTHPGQTCRQRSMSNAQSDCSCRR